jgi:hypothetical protein
MRSMKSIGRASSLALVLAGCAGKQVPVVKDVLHEVKVPVAAPCVNGPRPARVVPLREQFTADQWRALQVQQKTALVALQGLGLLKYGEDLGAAAAGCP